LADIAASRGEASLTLISYPTPQIATERLHAMESATLPRRNFLLQNAVEPIVAAVNVTFPPVEAQALLASVNYDADVTYHPGHET